MKRRNGRYTKTLDGEKRTTCLMLRVSTITTLKEMSESKKLSMSELVDLLIQDSPKPAQDPQSPTLVDARPQVTVGKPKYAI